EIALHAVEAAVDLRLDVAMCGDHAVVLGRNHDAAPGAAEPACRLVPFQLARIAFGNEVCRQGVCGHAAGECRHRCGLEFQNLTAVELGPRHCNSPQRV